MSTNDSNPVFAHQLFFLLCRSQRQVSIHKYRKIKKEKHNVRIESKVYYKKREFMLLCIIEIFDRPYFLLFMNVYIYIFFIIMY